MSCFTALRIPEAVSNSAGFERWVTSPVWSSIAGCFGNLVMRSSAACKVAFGSGLASLLKPIWLSLIWTKVNPSRAGEPGRGNGEAHEPGGDDVAKPDGVGVGMIEHGASRRVQRVPTIGINGRPCTPGRGWRTALDRRERSREAIRATLRDRTAPR